ncbi:unnamed protein product [Spirodela intermedia]|uniref:Aminotransferase-like plant mobile domain-containing protein n=1 Tax=Spirodela intermedia TaxID=51605 RepID=A0ABN7EBA7_SPIIN|nr:unnamed protein product [Spirodela intermedia]
MASQGPLPRWRLPQAKWGQWVEKLKPIYRNLWKRARIYDAIMASVCGIRRDSAAIFALLECWCPETSTFVLPWGRSTRASAGEAPRRLSTTTG